MADRVVQIAMTDVAVMALTEAGRVFRSRWSYEKGRHWEELPPVPGCESIQVADPWRDLTGDETRQVAIHSRNLGFLCGFGGAQSVWDAIRMVRGGGQ